MVKKAKKKAKKPPKGDKKPSAVEDEGRENNGRFAKGHKPILADRAAVTKSKELKDAMLAAVSVGDIQAITKKLVKKAKTGDIHAIKEVFDRCVGKPKETSDVNLNIPQFEDRPLTMDEMKKRIAESETAGDGIDHKSIEGSNGNNNDTKSDQS